MVANADRRIVAVPSWKRRRGKVLLGPDSENGEPRRGGSKVAEGSSFGAAGGPACGSGMGSSSFGRGGRLMGEGWKTPGER